jgi:hypothetical protein
MTLQEENQLRIHWLDRFFIGPVLIFTGILIFTGLTLLHFLFNQPSGWLNVLASMIVMEAYSIITLLFILVGLRHMLGPRNWIDQTASRTAFKAFYLATAITFILIVAWVIVLL